MDVGDDAKGECSGALYYVESLTDHFSVSRIIEDRRPKEDRRQRRREEV